MNIFQNQLMSTQNKSKTLLSNIVDKVTTESSRFILSKIMERYTIKLYISNYESIKKLIEYLKKYNKKLEKKLINGTALPNDSFTISIVDENTFVATVVGNPWISSSDRYLINKMYKSDDNPVTVYIGGKHAKKVLNTIKKETEISNKGLVIYTITNDPQKNTEGDTFKSVITDLKERNIDTLFYKDEIKNEITAHIDSFFNNREIYRKRNITFKTGILLYGEPGTGKTSLANALASKYGLNIVLVSMTTFDKLDVQTLTSCFNADDLTYLCLLEDIDTLYNINREDEAADKDDKKVINKLLQFLDSNTSPDNVIFVATTNYIDKLDDALLREGRFGKKFYIGPITEAEAIKMCKSFDCDDEMINNIMNKFEDKTRINQSQLQGFILDEIKEKELNGEEEIKDDQSK